jgi:hypothetical protein
MSSPRCPLSVSRGPRRLRPTAHEAPAHAPHIKTLSQHIIEDCCMVAKKCKTQVKLCTDLSAPCRLRPAFAERVFADRSQLQEIFPIFIQISARPRLTAAFCRRVTRPALRLRSANARSLSGVEGRSLSGVEGRSLSGVEGPLSLKLLRSANLPLFTFLPLQGGGQEGDGLALAPDLTHPHPNPPLEGEGVFPAEDQRFFFRIFLHFNLSGTVRAK